tara:strand:- start:1439 stop:2305 length:867 start_codon:yes stop_codon:yes gene_type:complete
MISIEASFIGMDFTGHRPRPKAPYDTRSSCPLILFFLFFVGPMGLIAQETIELEGRVYSGDGDVSGTHVINKRSQKATITDANGYFTISVQLRDSLLFSAVQYKRNTVTISEKEMKSKLLFVRLEDALTTLNEVVVTPYNLTGDVARDVGRLPSGTLYTASTLRLPNAYVRPITQSQRKLYTARTWDFNWTSVKLDPIINYFSGRTKTLQQRVARERRIETIEAIRKSYHDSIYTKALGIPLSNIDDFILYCGNDTIFDTVIATNDRLKILEYLILKSQPYREGICLD